MNGLAGGMEKNMAYGLTLVRLTMGVMLFMAGYGKVFVAGLGGVAQRFENMGMFMPQVTGPFIGLLELVGGAALVIGLFTRYLGLIFAIQFVVATYAKVAMMQTGWNAARIDIMLVVVGLLLATNGGGALNLGTLLKKGS